MSNRIRHSSIWSQAQLVHEKSRKVHVIASHRLVKKYTSSTARARASTARASRPYGWSSQWNAASASCAPGMTYLQALEESRISTSDARRCLQRGLWYTQVHMCRRRHTRAASLRSEAKFFARGFQRAHWHSTKRSIASRSVLDEGAKTSAGQRLLMGELNLTRLIRSMDKQQPHCY